MNRRGFLSGLGALIGGIALEQAIPLGRVWSFPKEVKCLNVAPVIYPSLEPMATLYYDKLALDRLEHNFKFVAAAEELTLPKTFQTYRFSA